MKALSETIIIVVTAVVILVAALVILTIFGGGVGNVSTLTNFKSQCLTQCSMTCKMGALPPTWTTQVSVGDTKTTCATAVGKDCIACCGASGGVWCNVEKICASNIEQCTGGTGQ